MPGLGTQEARTPANRASHHPSDGGWTVAHAGPLGRARTGLAVPGEARVRVRTTTCTRSSSSPAAPRRTLSCLVSEHVPARAVQYRHPWQRRAGNLLPAPPGGEPVAPILFRPQVWRARAEGPGRRRRPACGGGRRATPRRRFGRGLATPDAQRPLAEAGRSRLMLARTPPRGPRSRARASGRGCWSGNPRGARTRPARWLALRRPAGRCPA